jgi:hypothetical protein
VSRPRRLEFSASHELRAFPLVFHDSGQRARPDQYVYRKVSFAPEPVESGSLWGDVAGWLRQVNMTSLGAEPSAE